MRERVARPADGALAAADRRRAPQHQVVRPRLRLGDLLLQPHFVAQCRPSVNVVKAFCHNRDDEDGDCKKQCEPEDGCTHHVPSRAHVLVADKV